MAAPDHFTPDDAARRENPYAPPLSEDADDVPDWAKKDGPEGSFSRWYVLLWLGSAAAAYFNDHWLTNVPALFGWSSEMVRQAAVGISAIVHGIPMATALVCVARRYRIAHFPAQPGEYWLVANGIGLWLKIALFSILGIALLPPTAELSLVAIHSLIVVAMFFYAAYQVRLWRSWSVFLGALGVMMLGSLLQQIAYLSQLSSTGIPSTTSTLPFGMVTFTSLCVALVAVGMAIDRDRREKPRRGWIHRLAIWWIMAHIIATVLRVLV